MSRGAGAAAPSLPPRPPPFSEAEAPLENGAQGRNHHLGGLSLFFLLLLPLLAAASKGACRAQEHLRGGGGRDRGGVLGRRSLF